MDSLLNVPHQTGTAVLDLNGNLVNSTGDLAGNHGEHVSKVIQTLLLDCGDLHFLKTDAPDNESLERLTIAFPTYQYVVAFGDDDHVFVVKQDLEDN